MQIEAQDASLFASVTHDSRDGTTFARHGLASELRYVQADESLGGDRDWSRIEAGFRKAVPFGKSAVWSAGSQTAGASGSRSAGL